MKNHFADGSTLVEIGSGTVALAHLVQEEMLVKMGETRASVYHLPGKQPAELPLSFLTSSELNSLDLTANSPDLIGSSSDLTGNSPDLKKKLSEYLTSMGFKILPGKLKEPIMREVIMHLCDENTLTLKVLSSILERDPKALQDQYLTPMLAEGLFELRYPENKNHPNQAYRKKK